MKKERTGDYFPSLNNRSFMNSKLRLPSNAISHPNSLTQRGSNHQTSFPRIQSKLLINSLVEKTGNIDFEDKIIGKKSFMHCSSQNFISPVQWCRSNDENNETTRFLGIKYCHNGVHENVRRHMNMRLHDQENSDEGIKVSTKIQSKIDNHYRTCQQQVRTQAKYQQRVNNHYNTHQVECVKKHSHLNNLQAMKGTNPEGQRKFIFPLLPADIINRIAYFLSTPEQVFKLSCINKHYFHILFKDANFWVQYFQNVYNIRISPIGSVNSLTKYIQWKMNRNRFHTTHTILSVVKFSKHAHKVRNLSQRGYYLPIRWRYSIPKFGIWESTITFQSSDINVNSWPGVGLVTKEVMYGKKYTSKTVVHYDSKGNLTNGIQNGKHSLQDIIKPRKHMDASIHEKNLFMYPGDDILLRAQHCGLYHTNRELSQQNIGYFSNGVVCRMGVMLTGLGKFVSGSSVTMRVSPSFSLSPSQTQMIEDNQREQYDQLMRGLVNRNGLIQSLRATNRAQRNSENHQLCSAPNTTIPPHILVPGIFGDDNHKINGCGMVEFIVNGKLVLRLFNIVDKFEDYDQNPLIPICNLPSNCQARIVSCRYFNE